MNRFVRKHWKALLAGAVALVLVTGVVAWRVLFVPDPEWVAENQAQEQKLQDLDALLEKQADVSTR